MLGNNWHKKEMPLVSLAGMGGGLSSPAFLASLILNITKPTVFSPLDDSGVPDFTYNALSSTITDITTSSINLTGTSGSFIPGSYVKDANSTIIPSDIASVDGSTISFSSAVDLTSITAPLEMVDASGNTIAPTTSNVTIATPIAGTSLVTNYTFNYMDGATTEGWPKLINSGANMHPGNSMPKGDRMLWIKPNWNGHNAISDSVALNGRLLYTSSSSRDVVIDNPGPSGQNVIEFGEHFTRLPYGSSPLGTIDGIGTVYATEIAVSPGLLDIVTWNGTGTSSTDRRIPHSLGSVPGMIIVKRMDASQDWYVYHSAKGVNSKAALNYTWSWSESNAWGSAPTSTDFGINEDTLNSSSGEYVAYVFAENTPGKIKCGTYTGNGSSSNFVDVGFSPGFVLLKDADHQGHSWHAATAFSMVNNKYWKPSYNSFMPDNGLYSGQFAINNTETSFVLRGNEAQYNGSGRTYVYLAIAKDEPGGLRIMSEDTTQLTFQDDTNLDQLTSGMTVSLDIPQTLGSTFSVDTYTGNSSTQTINNGIDLAGEGGLVWIKHRELNPSNHVLYDTERGATHWLNTDNSNAEGDPGGTFITYNSDGFTLENNATLNYAGSDLVSWTFRKAPGFFDIVTYTGNGGSTGGAGDDGSNSRDVPHNLGTTPGMILVKCLDNSNGWFVWHKDYQNTTTDWMSLNTTGGVNSHSNMWGAVNESSFGVTNRQDLNNDGLNYVAYVFADNPSNQIKCGSYAGNGSESNFIELGFEPQFYLVKSTTSGVTDWIMVDSARGMNVGGNDAVLIANLWNSEIQTDNRVDFTSTGFYAGVGGNDNNASGRDYIYLAIGSPTALSSVPTAKLTADADPSTNTAIIDASSWTAGYSVTGPASIATASGFDENIVNLILTDTTVSKASDGSLVKGTLIDQVLTVGERIQADTVISNTVSFPVFSVDTYTGNSGTQAINNGIDLAGGGGLVWLKKRSDNGNNWIFDTERGANSRLITNTTGQAFTAVEGLSFNSNGFTVNNDNSINASGADHVMWSFRKAPGFFDIVTWTGDGSGTRDINHSLGSSPAVMIWKKVNATSDWSVYHKDAGTGYNLYLNTTNSKLDTSLWGTGPTATNFPAHAAFNLTSEEYVAYLFAEDTPGLIKCGSYLGNAVGGAAPYVPNQIDCGFRPKFVLIKNTGSDTGWYITDDQRGDDKYLQSNSWDLEGGFNPAAVVFNDTGFSLPTGHHYVNHNNVEHIFIAISENPEVNITTESTISGTVSASSGNIITVSDISNSWSTGMKVRGIDSDLKDYPDAILAQDISLTSSSPTAAHTVNNWGDAVWEVATDAAFTQNVQTSSTALSASGTQSGPTFSYNSNTGYYVRTKYTALGQESAWSDTNYFITQLALDIEKPTILTPTDDTGVPDFDYTALSSAITSVDVVTGGRAIDLGVGLNFPAGAMVYGGGKFVAVAHWDATPGGYGGTNQVVYSDDGISWNIASSAQSNSWNSITYGAGKFVAVSPSGSYQVMYSSDGINWSPASASNTSANWTSVTYGGGKFVAVAGGGSGDRVMYSNDGINWSSVSATAATSGTPLWRDVEYADGKFVAVASAGSTGDHVEGKVMYSSDGINWHESNTVDSNQWYAVTYGAGKWVAVGQDGSGGWRNETNNRAMYSSDGINWTSVLAVNNHWRDITYGDGKFVAVAHCCGTGDRIMYSYDGIDWEVAQSETRGWYTVAYGDGKFVALPYGEDRVTYSYNGTNWIGDETQLTLTDTTVSKVSDGSLVGVTIDQALTVGETVQADTAVTGTVTVPVFTTTLWSGTGSAHEIVTGIDNTANTLIWTKSRNYSNHHRLYTPAVDSIIGYPSVLYSSNSNSPGSTGSSDVTEFTANGFRVGDESNANTGPMNSANLNYVAWNFRAAPGFLDIVTYTSQSGVSAIDHNLGSVPGCIIVKKVSGGTSWQVYHKDLDSGKLLELDGYQDQATRNGFPSAPTSTQFFIDPISHNTFGNVGDQFVAYLFAEDTPGLIKCGIYTGNGNSSQTVDLGFETGLLITKPKNLDQGWMIIDSERKTDSGTHNAFSQPNELSPDNTFNEFHSLTSTGFTAGSSANASNRQTIYIAIAKNAESEITGDVYASGTVSSTSGNTITLSDVSGTWLAGTKVQGVDSDTKDNADPIDFDSVSLTSSEPSVPQVLPSGQSWDTATWQIATDENFTQNVRTETSALSATGIQSGPSLTFEPDTGYYARTKYTALGQESEWSDVTYFLTEGLPAHWFTTISDPNGLNLGQQSSLVTDSQNNVLVTAVTTRNHHNLVKFDPQGNISWQRKYSKSGVSFYYQFGQNCIDVDSNDDIFIGVMGSGSDGTDMITAKYSNSGTLEWQRKMTFSNDRTEAVATDSSGSVFNVGYTESHQQMGNGSGYTINVTKHDSSGNHLFTRAYGNNDDRGYYARDAHVDSSGNLLIVGDFTTNTGISYPYLHKLSGTDGTIIYGRVLGNTYHANGSSGVTTDSSGNIYAAWRARDSSGVYNILFAKYNSSGTLEWKKEIYDGYSKHVSAVDVDSSDNIYIWGASDYPNGVHTGASGILIKMDSSGSMIWQRLISGPNTINHGGMSVDTADNIAICGQVYPSSGNASIFVGKVPSDGSLMGTYNTTFGTYVYAEASNSIRDATSRNSANYAFTRSPQQTGGFTNNENYDSDVGNLTSSFTLLE